MFLKVDLKRKHKKNRRTRPQAKRQQQTRRQVRSRLMKAQVPSYQLELLLLASPIPPAMHHLRSQVLSPWAAWFNLDTVKAWLLVYSSLLVGWAVHFLVLDILRFWNSDVLSMHHVRQKRWTDTQTSRDPCEARKVSDPNLALSKSKRHEQWQILQNPLNSYYSS